MLTKFGLLLLVGCATVAVAQAQSSADPSVPPVQVEPGLAPAEPGSVPPAEAVPPPPTMARVHVSVDNVETSEGNVWVALCDTALSWEGCPYRTHVAATAGIVEVTFENIPPGAYAVVGYHDVNGNNQFDKTLGVPREPYALSGPAADMLVPKFKDAVLRIDAGDNDVTIRLHGVID